KRVFLVILFTSFSGSLVSRIPGAVQAYRVWRKTPEKAADPTLIRKLPDGEIRRYNRRQNIICRECRQSEVMQRVLAFYQGNFQEAVL
ncbi:DUF977 family protein, partial [Escherichia coli]